MLRAFSDWATAARTVHPHEHEDVLTVRGDYRSCDPEALAREVAKYVGTSPGDVTASSDTLIIVGALGTFADPSDYMAQIDEAVSAAECETLAIIGYMSFVAQVAAVNIARFRNTAALTEDGLMRAALVDPDEGKPLLTGKSLPTAPLVRIATALGVTIEDILRPPLRGL